MYTVVRRQTTLITTKRLMQNIADHIMICVYMYLESGGYYTVQLTYIRIFSQAH